MGKQCEAPTPLLDTVMKQLSDFDGIADLQPYYHDPEHVQTNFLKHRMLVPPWRNFVIKEIKDPIREAIVLLGRVNSKGIIGKIKRLWFAYKLAETLILTHRKFILKFGKIGKKNTAFRNTHNWLDLKGKFKEYYAHGVPLERCIRNEMFDAAFDIWIAENEHDTHYQFIGDWLLEEIVKLILSGEWQPRPEGYPAQNWGEPKPYGGRHSIIYKIQQKREEILKLIGEV